MQAASAAGDVWALLEGNVEELLSLYSAVREPWLVRALLCYHARTQAPRALELLARAPEPHARHLLDALHEQLARREARAAALQALAPLVALRPAWLHRLPAHPAARGLLRAAAAARQPEPLLHALLALAALLPAAPALPAAHWPELAAALLRPAALEPPPPPPVRLQLQLAALALFRTLYATHPCSLMDALRAQLPAPGARDAAERALRPLLLSVRLHPALLLSSREREADAARWARAEPHDILHEARRLELPAPPRAPASPAPALPALPPPATPPPGSGEHAARLAGAALPGAEGWAPLSELALESAPATPLPADADGAEPPEAAVEATPENTPARETRAHQFRFPAEAAVRVLGEEGARDALAGRLGRLAQERRAAGSPVPVGDAPPAGLLARPEARGAAPEADEDREVRELTARSALEADARDAEVDGPLSLPPSRGALGPAPPGRPRGPAVRRAASCGPPGSARCDMAVQTLDMWPAPYEFIISDFYRSVPEEVLDSGVPAGGAGGSGALEGYLDALYRGTLPRGAAAPAALLHAQLLYERSRRDAHAERNRRLLGRCRRARAAELANAALRTRLAALAVEREPPRRAPPPPDRALDAALEAERAARLRAEAALAEAQAARAQDAAELQRTRGETFEAARHVEALARAAAAAERRGEHVRRLRRELLLLAERSARLADGAGEAGVLRAEAGRARDEARALRAAAARAEADALAAAARAELAAARAHELEASLAAREAALAELKRNARAQHEEQASRMRAVQDKYEALVRAVHAGEARRMREAALAPRAPPPAAAPAPPAPPAQPVD